MIIVSNTIMLVLALVYFFRLIAARTDYARKMAWFILLIGIGGIFGAICHSVHFQLGQRFFNSMFFLMNAMSLFSIFFCFWSTWIHATAHRARPKSIFVLAALYIVALLIFSYIEGDFLLIKINAGLTLIYSLVVYLKAWRNRAERGSLLIVWGIVASFVSILVHSLRISFHEWFNYKDLAHVFMIVALVLIARGGLLNSRLHSDTSAISNHGYDSPSSGNV